MLIVIWQSDTSAMILENPRNMGHAGPSITQQHLLVAANSP